MRKIFFIICLIYIAFCSSVVKNLTKNGKISERRNKLLECILSTKGISEKLKVEVNEIKASEEKYRLNFKRAELEENDRKIIKSCIKSAFTSKKRTPDNLQKSQKSEIGINKSMNNQQKKNKFKILPLKDVKPAYKNKLVPKEKIKLIYKNKLIKAKPIARRNLGTFSSLFSFKFTGIFECLEYAQPAIEIIRGAINMIRSQDFTTAVISIYDNLSLIGDSLSFCYNSIFPSE